MEVAQDGQSIVGPRETRPYDGYFDRMKRMDRQHRGFVRPHRDAYGQWYVQLWLR